MQPNTKHSECPICGGHRDLPQGRGVRCFGFVSESRDYAVCSREELAGPIARNPKTSGYHHRLGGPCRCGQVHAALDGAEVRGIGEAKGARIVATYDYTDERGTLLYQVVRKEPKAFLQRCPDGAGGWRWQGPERAVPYRLPEVVTAVAAGDTVHIAEGEKDCDAICAAGGIATCNHAGAGKWHAEHAAWLQGANVVIVADRDEPGKEHARKVYASLRGIAASVRVVEARTGKDAHDHLAAGGTLDSFLPVWPLDEVKRTDPVEWKRAVLRKSLDSGDPFRRVDVRTAQHGDDDPRWPTGLEGGCPSLPNFRGVTILTGAPSSGKTFLAIASAVQAAWAGWDVVYLSSEMSDRVLSRRIGAYAGMRGVPDALHVEGVSFGADVSGLVDLVVSRVGAANLLVVFDSVSSFVDQALTKSGEDDVHQIGPLKQLMMWAVNVRRHTEGQVSFLMLSETNREGRTKGRFGDHKADLVVTLESDKLVSSSKRLTVVKGWEYQAGEAGLFGLDWRSGRMTRLGGETWSE